MDKCKLLEEVERPNTSKTKLGLKVLSFCFCVVFLGSVLLNVYYIRNMTENKNGVHNGHNIQHGHGLASSIKKFIPKMAADKNARQEKRSFKKQCDGTDCGDGGCCDVPDFPVCCPDTDYYTNWCAATADDCPSSIRKFIPKMAADKNARQEKRSSKKDCDGTDCGDGGCCNDADFPVCCGDGIWCGATADDCPSSVRKFLPKMAADKRSYKKQCDGTDCGDGGCCDDPDYPVCCPDTDYYTNWCAATADDCPSSIRKFLPKMAADKNARQEKRSSKKQCDGTDCGNGYCCNDADYPVCCPDGLWCGATADDCPSSIKKFLTMAADKRSSKKDTDCGNGWWCDDSDYPICCPMSDDGTQWCADTDDDCPSSIKKLSAMAADKRSYKKDCDGTDCGNGWCCNESDYPVCCPEGDDGTQWCADDADDCPSSIKKFLPKMAADKNDKEYCYGTSCVDAYYAEYCCNNAYLPLCCYDYYAGYGCCSY